MALLRIVDWDEHFENNRTRDLKHMAWVPIPNKFDGDGYTSLVDHHNGAAHLGAWVAILEVASKCDPRGTLVRDTGAEHSPQSLARMSRLPAAIFAEVIPRLISIGWIEELACNSPHSDSPHVTAAIPQEDAVMSHPSDQEQKGTELKELNGTDWNAERAFEEFFNSYPKKVKRLESWRAFLIAIASQKDHESLMSGMRRWLASDQWSRSIESDGGRYVHDPDKFIRDRLYRDEPQPRVETRGQTSTTRQSTSIADLIDGVFKEKV